MRVKRVAGVLLAAGTSSRMGRNKLFLTLGGTTLVTRAATTAIAGGLDPVLVVVGHERERVLAELAKVPVTPVYNPDYARGINSSLRAGLTAVPDDAEGAVIMLADMPFVTAEMVQTIVSSGLAPAAPLVVSSYDGEIAPPILYPRRLFPELRALVDGDGCGKRVVKQHRAEALEVAWPASALRDLDVADDVERARADLEED